jgi:hypothetical protein
VWVDENQTASGRRYHWREDYWWPGEMAGIEKEGIDIKKFTHEK